MNEKTTENGNIEKCRRNEHENQEKTKTNIKGRYNGWKEQRDRILKVKYANAYTIISIPILASKDNVLYRDQKKLVP